MLDCLLFARYRQVRELEGRKTSPSAALADSQSAKSAENGKHIDSVSFDAAKKVKGKKRHVMVDTLGLMLEVDVSPGDL